MPADASAVLVNARVWPRGDRVAIAGAVIGSEDADGERIDVGGARIVPGLVDAHVHFPSWALGRRELSLFGTGSRSEALERIEAAAGRGEGWLRGRGWREEAWPEGERPALTALDEVTGDVPTALRAHDGHTLWVNSAALAAARAATTGEDVAGAARAAARPCGGEPGGPRGGGGGGFFAPIPAAPPAATRPPGRAASPPPPAPGG